MNRSKESLEGGRPLSREEKIMEVAANLNGVITFIKKRVIAVPNPDHWEKLYNIDGTVYKERELPPQESP